MRNVHSSRVKGLGWYASALMCLAILGLPAKAQDAATEEFTGSQLWPRGGCSNCHGNLADGAGDGAYPPGPNLRRSAPDRDQLIEVIGCGRPGTEMPYNLAGAYTEVSCYDIPLGEPPGVNRGARFTGEQIDTLVDFLLEHVVGQATITRENCGAFFGGNIDGPLCRKY